MAHITMKDLPWKRYLAGPEKGDVINAHEKELDALLTTKLTDSRGVERVVLEELTEDHPAPGGSSTLFSIQVCVAFGAGRVWAAW